jgi:hypothetical protein
MGALRVAGLIEDSRQESRGNATRWSLLTWDSKEFPENPRIDDGRYRTVQVELAWDRVDPFLLIVPADVVDVRLSVTALSGAAQDTDATFTLGEALASVSFPVGATGYEPITLTLLGAIGASGGELPPQYQFRLRTSAASIGKPGGMISPPKGLYGGTRYFAAGMEVNLTDLPWRAVGLPRRHGRGVELILSGAAARYDQRMNRGFTGTGGQWYSEIGISLGRIPLFLTDVIAARVDARFGLGPLGRFGANFTLVVPV